ncbi:SDR family NAD(P)-dependent oxidoreductase [Actinoplanes sp. URMC 104]|uniref:SDR family NAD(P)-dependent oxidoreductase n=1 Tax=Actinoplanes sp. URMC 104 TaxID=3423409 RepID=UPI003F1970F8
MSDNTLDPQHALVIGAGPGLGLAVARRFAREGFAITLVARDADNLAKLADELRADGATVDTFTADAGDVTGFRTGLEQLSQRITPGVVVYNAAVVRPDSLLATAAEELQHTYAINVLGGITTAQVFTPAMRAARSGTLLITGGGVARHPSARLGSLSLGKVGVRAAVTMLAEELAPDGVHVAGVTVAGGIAPGTPFDPDVIAGNYWTLHTQPPAQWSTDIYFDGQ